MLTRRGRKTPSERGQVAMLFALLIPMLLAMSAFVIGIGNWFVHAKHLQTKADAGAIAGGGTFEFPCVAGIDAIDQRIANLARQYAGPAAAPPVASPTPGYNPQVGGVATSSIHAVLNGPDWYDDDGNPAPTEDLDICDGGTPLRLDVKVTEDNSFPLASLIPLFPDIKRKAVVELFQTDGMSGLLPIAVRAPEPASAMAIFYNEANGAILDRKYFVKKTGPGLPGLPGLPASLQGWSTENPSDPNAQGWASVQVAGKTGVVVAISYRGACGTWGAPGPSGPPPGVFIEPTGSCLEDGLGPAGTPSYANVNEICNQGGSVQVANCYFTTDPGPSTPNDEIVQSGLQFIRGHTSPTAGAGPPELHIAYLAPGSCGTGYGTGYFASFPNVCSATISASIDAGSCFRLPAGGGCVASGTPTATETRTAANVEVKYTLVFGTGNPDDICDFGSTCDLADSGTGIISANGTVAMPPDKTRYAVALRVRMKDTFVQGKPSCGNPGFNGGCEWYFLGSGRVNTEPNNATIFADEVQRGFRGNSVTAGSIRWLRMKADRSPCVSPVPADEFAFGGEEGSQPLGATSCFVVEMGLKGGLATDADDQPILFNDGIGSSQLGYLDCTATGPQNIVWELMNGCPPLYGPNKFTTNPLCPPANDLFTTPNPGPPWDVDWPPLRCVKTRPTSQGNDLTKGLNGRFFFPNDPNPSPQPPSTCPNQVGNGYTQGRNYWKNDALTNPNYGYYEDDGSWVTTFDPLDARLVTIFLTTPESFTGSGQNTYPITGAIGVYITGYGKISGNGLVQVDDPCAGPLPSDLDVSGGSSGGRVLWGYFVNLTVLSAGATPSNVACNPGGSTQPCVPILVE